jgi:uncharacterized RDD family membrane protein YckC
MPPGWYPARGDQPGTVRWWDGRNWQGEPVIGGAPSQSAYPGHPAYPAYPAATRDSLPELGRVLAGPWHRIAARVIDSLLVGFVTGIVFVIVAFDDVDVDDMSGFGGYEGELYRWSIALALVGVAWEVVWVALRGATPGKLALGITIIRTDGTTPPGWGAAVRRNLLAVANLVPIVTYVVLVLEVASLVLLFADPRRRTIDDRIADTYVVRSR